MSLREEARERGGQVHEEATEQPYAQSEPQTTRFTSRGVIPPVAQSTSTTEPTASERAYGSHPAPKNADVFENASLWALDKDGKPLPPSLEDIAQGGMGDCYLMASLAAIVATDPQKIVSMIHDQGDGLYTVHFHQAGWAFVSPTVTASFEKTKHSRIGNRSALWPLIIEKAFAQTKGGLDRFQSGNPATVMGDLVGMETTSFVPSLKEPASIMAAIAAGKAERKAMTASTVAWLPDATERNAVAKKHHVHTTHVYTVIDADPTKGQIRLHNPWGFDHPNETGWIDVELFKTLFIGVNISG